MLEGSDGIHFSNSYFIAGNPLLPLVSSLFPYLISFHEVMNYYGQAMDNSVFNNLISMHANG